MSDRFFLDTNLFIYAIDPSDARKHRIAIEWLAAAHQSGKGMVSYQVVQEWFNVVLRKSARPMKIEDAVSIYQRLIHPLWRVHSSQELLAGAIDLHRDRSFSWWDSLIVSAAIQGGCGQLLSEDLHHGHAIGNLTIVNPFLEV
jgi:predicted nucleic acid-binding protein